MIIRNESDKDRAINYAIFLRKKGLTTYDISNKIGKAPNTIWRWLKKYGEYKSFVGRNSKDNHHSWKGGKSRDYIAKTALSILSENDKDIEHCWRCDAISNGKRKLHIHHVDRNMMNNNFSNLEILCPQCHRNEHYENDLLPGNAKLTKKTVLKIREEYKKEKTSYSMLSEKYGITVGHVGNIINYRKWK